MELPPDFPETLDLRGHDLQRLRFEEPRRLADRLESLARYDIKRPTGEVERVAVRASAPLDAAEDLQTAIAEMYAAFELRELGADLERLEPEGYTKKEGEPELPEEEQSNLDLDVVFEVSLVSPSEAPGKVLAFVIDPRIDKSETPHRWEPERAANVWVRMRIDAGAATVRVFRGTHPTDRAIRRDDLGWTNWLKADTNPPRVRVNGHQNGTRYVIGGGWDQI